MCTLLWLVHCTAICQNLSSLATNFILWIGLHYHLLAYSQAKGDFWTTHIQDNATHYETADKIEVKIAYWSKDTWSLRDRTSYHEDQFLLKTIWIHRRTNIPFADKMWVQGNHNASKTKIYNLLGTSNNTRHLCVVGVKIPTEHPCHEKEYNTLCLTYNAWVQY